MMYGEITSITTYYKSGEINSFEIKFVGKHRLVLSVSEATKIMEFICKQLPNKEKVEFTHSPHERDKG